MLDHATSEIASGDKLGIDATKKLPGEGFRRPWPPLITMDEVSQRKLMRCSEQTAVADMRRDRRLGSHGDAGPHGGEVL